MVGANASGDLKLKPLMIHRHANPRALRGIVKSSLGVYYRYSKRGWMTAQVCLDIFSNAYVNDIKKYSNEKNLAFKVLVIMDSAPSHPPMIAELDPNVHFVFLPARTTSLLQPLDQGVIGAFKAYYLRRTFKMLIDATDGENCETVMEFWKNYNLRMAINNIVEAWNDVSKRCLHRVWRKLIPDLICDFKDFEPSAQVCEITESCVQLANRLGFEGVEYQHIEDILSCQPDELTTEELQELSVAGEAEGREEDDENQEVPPPPPRQMTTAELSDTLETIEQRLQWLEDNDCNAERSGKTTRGIRACLEPYKQLLYERSTRAKQKKLEFYFTAMKKHCDDEEALPSTSNRTSVRP
uniref:DDE-1 domain-containing protein n=1 Tax=Trichuris muris TaxID=70415 RepID=A0A5S6QV23_TRIMR